MGRADRIDLYSIYSLAIGKEILSGSPFIETLDDGALWRFTRYILAQTLVAFIAGTLLAKAAERIGWGKRVALASPSGHWHEAFLYAPERPDGIIVSLTVSLSGRTYLYYGFLHDYVADPLTGQLARVFLRYASRREMGSGADKKVYDLPGEVFIVECGDVQTIVVDYNLKSMFFLEIFCQPIKSCF